MEDLRALTELCVKELELCGVHEGETVAVVSHERERLDYADAFLAAARRLGATSFNVRLPDAATGLTNDAGAWNVGATPLGGNRPAIEALKNADMVIDLVFLLFSPEQLEIQAAGTRILLCIEPVDNLARMMGTPDLRRRCEHGAELLSKASELRFTNDHGTDVTYRLGTYPAVTEYGYTDEPGRWDHWPSGFLWTGGDDDGVDGRVVVAPGDIVFPFKTYVQTPIDIRIENGRIVDIRGGVDAELLKDYMETFDDPRGYALSHIGWGLNERARWSGMATDRRSIGVEARAYYGNVLFSTGPNGELGGDNDTPCHVDIPMRGCSLFLDDEPILIDGDVVVDEMKAPQAVGA
jgi:2,5-dihydroxypyridine 5,6-dioxygenase